MTTLTLAQYQKLALRTLSSNFFVNNPMPPLLHAAMGIDTEAGELLEAFCNNFEIDKVNVCEEIGDMLWFFAIYAEFGEEDSSKFKKTSGLYLTWRITGLLSAQQAAIQVMVNACKFLDVFKSAIYYNKPLDFLKLDAIQDEIMCGLNNLAIWCDTTLEKIAETNIKKLQARYPEKFTDELANNRDLAVERDALEDTGC